MSLSQNAQHLASAALYAITRFVEAPSPERAALVARHLDCVAAQADAEPGLRDLCQFLAVRWRGCAVINTSSALLAH